MTISDRYFELVAKIDEVYASPSADPQQAHADALEAYARLNAEFGQELAVEYAPTASQEQREVLYTEAVTRAGSPSAYFWIEEHFRDLAETFFPSAPN